MKLVFEDKEAQGLLKKLLLKEFPDATDVKINITVDKDDRTGMETKWISSIEVTTKSEE